MYAEDGPRYRAALAMLENARRHHIRVLISEGSPEPFASTVRKAFSDLGANILERKTTGMGAHRRELWRAAFRDADIVTWTEPEKVELPIHLKLGVEQVEGGKNIVVPCRHPSNMKTYPSFQRQCELVANRSVSLMSGIPDELDWWFGPKIMDKKGGRHFLDYDGTASDGGVNYPDLWEHLQIPVIRAYSDGLRIGWTITNCPYPTAQRDEEEGNRIVDMKRVAQLAQILEAIRRECLALGLPK
jgi:hypothetical protein